MATSKFAAMAMAAEKHGYAGRLAASTLSYKQYGCKNCRRNSAVKFVARDESHAVLACICGWREKTSNLR